MRQRLVAIETAESAPPAPLRAADGTIVTAANGNGAPETPHITSIPRRNESFPPLGPQPGRSGGGGGSIPSRADRGMTTNANGEPVPEETPFEANVSAYYYRNQSTTLITELESHTTDTDSQILQNAIVLSFDVSDSFLRGGQTYSYRFSGEYEQDLSDASNSGLNLSRVYGELKFGDDGAAISVGRQSWNDDATLGRYDGVRLSYPVSAGLRVSGVAGLAVNSQSDGMFSGSSLVYGAVADLTGLGKDREATVYGLGQTNGGFTERMVVGAEGSMSNDHNNLYGLIEFDMSFASLNTARVSWNHIYADTSSLSLTADYTHSPSLGLSSALNGQTVTNLAALSALYTTAEMRDLALDRTQKLLTLSAAWQKPINDKWQLSVDGAIYHTSGMPASGGVAAVEAPGWDYYASAQVVGSSVLTESDVLSLSARLADDASSKLVMLDGYWRYGVTDKLRIKPRLQVAHRDFASGGAENFAIPSISMDYEVNDRSSLNLELGTRLSNTATPGFSEETTEPYLTAGFSQQF